MLLAACGGEYAPRTGDLLFQLTAAEGMTDAIVAATERGGAVTFSHVGIVEATAGGACVVEAVETSVRRTPLGEFLARSARRGGRPIAAVGRVRGADSTVVQRALRRAHERLGLSYDDEFLPANGDENLMNFMETVDTIEPIPDAFYNPLAKHPNISEFPKISMIWKSIPSQLARENKKFIYKVVKEGARAREYETAFEVLY